jgi:allantoate deiminase
VPVDAASVLERADELAAFTETPGGITRGYGSAALVGALDAVAGWMAKTGLAVRRDPLGTVIGRQGGNGPAFVVGSHVDSVRDAGRYDGPLGVLVALAAVERLGASSAVPVEVVAFADEEGLRYRASYLASRAVAGLLAVGELAEVDDAGVRLDDAVRATGGDPAALDSARWDPAGVLGYLEVHIEQGPVLEAEDLPVGIVTAIAGQSRGFVELVGTAGHAGNTPPALRRDALPGVAELVLAVERAMHREPGLVATVGRVEVEPNVGNVIPGRVSLSYDVRHQDDRVKESSVANLRAEAASICERRGLHLEWSELQDHPAVTMSPRLGRALAAAVRSSGVMPFELPSGAGHDAVPISRLTDVAMLFVRCRGGISHHPDESVREDDVAVAIDVVEAFLRSLGEERRLSNRAAAKTG